MRETSPVFVVTVDRQVAEGESVATCVTARDTHRGEGTGITPAGV